MKSFSRFLLAMLCVLGLLSCTQQAPPGCSNLPGNGEYCLQSTQQLPAFEAQQLVEARYKGRKEILLAEIESGSSVLHFVGLSPLGHKLLHITYDNKQAHAFTTPNKRLDPTLLVALLQLTLWPGDAVEKGLKGTLKLEETPNRRRFLNGQQTVIDIHRHGKHLPYDRIQISIPSAELELDIKTLEKVSATEKKL